MQCAAIGLGTDRHAAPGGIDGAAVLDIAAGIDKLALQISQPVRWAACLESCVEAGANAFLELGPGRALANMASRTPSSLPGHAFDRRISLGAELG